MCFPFPSLAQKCGQKRRVVQFQEQVAPDRVFFPTGDQAGSALGSQSKIRVWILDRLMEQLKGLYRRPLSFRGRASGSSSFPVVGVCYNGSLLCWGHFKEKLSSVNMQPASLAHG